MNYLHFFTDKQISQSILFIVLYKYLKSGSKEFIP